MNNTIYHYCNLNSFEGIIRSKNLWLSNSLISNDSYELTWMFNLMLDSCKSNREKIKYTLNLKSIYLESLSFFKPHMLCFSKTPDLLSQWRGYADNGKGVCIGFNRDYFEKSKSVNKNKEFEIYDILYKKGQQKKIIDLYIKEHFFERNIETILINYDDMRFRIEALKMTKQLLKLCIQFKNPSFSEENEVRIVHGFPELAAEPDSFSFRFTDDNLISYLEIPLTHKKYYPVINEIILGPKCKIDINQFKRFLGERIGFHTVEIKHSNCSFH